MLSLEVRVADSLAGAFGGMVRISVLHDALKTMYNAEKRGKRQVLIRPSSKVVIKFLQVMMKHGKQSSTLFRFSYYIETQLCPSICTDALWHAATG